MPGATPNKGYPYPLGPEPVDVAGDIRKLAEAIDIGDVAQDVLINSSARGWMAEARLTSDFPGFTTEVDVPGMSVGFVNPGNRRYRISVTVRGQVQGDHEGVIVFRITRGDNTGLQWGIVSGDPLEAPYHTVSPFITDVPPAGEVSYKLRASAQSTAGGSVTGWLRALPTSPAIIVVEDIGPA